jgi:hypothetical protein
MESPLRAVVFQSAQFVSSDSASYVCAGVVIAPRQGGMHSLDCVFQLTSGDFLRSASLILSADDARSLSRELGEAANDIPEEIGPLPIDLDNLEGGFRRMILQHLDTFDEVIDTFRQRKNELDEKHRAVFEQMCEQHQRARDLLNQSNVASGTPDEVAAAMDSLNQVFFCFHQINKALKLY